MVNPRNPRNPRNPGNLGNPGNLKNRRNPGNLKNRRNPGNLKNSRSNLFDNIYYQTNNLKKINTTELYPVNKFHYHIQATLSFFHNIQILQESD